MRCVTLTNKTSRKKKKRREKEKKIRRETEWKCKWSCILKTRHKKGSLATNTIILMAPI